MRKKLLTYVKKFRRAAMLSLVVVAVLAMVPAMVFAFGPDRPTFDYNKAPVNGSTCTSADEAAHDICGSLTGPVFDSFVNTPGYGDEESFVTIAQAPDGNTNPVGDNFSHTLTAVPGQSYWLRIYVHNNANQGKNCSADHLDANGDCTQLDAGSPGIATNTHVQLAFNQGQANGQDLKAYISADNADKVWDEATLTNDANQFSLAYVPGSAVALTNGQNTTLQPLNDDIAGPNGVKLGEDFNGNVNNSGNYPGCFNFVSRIYVKVIAKAPALKVTKQAFVSGTQNEVDGKSVAPGTHVTWKVHFSNLGSDVANNVTLRDTLPQDDTFVPGTLKWYDASQNGVVQNSGNEDIFFNKGGINFGNYAALTDAEKTAGDDSADFTYQTVVGDAPNVCQITNTVFVRTTGTPETSATSTVNVSNASCTPATLLSTPVATSLPNTGPGSVLGLFAGVTAAGALFHRYFLGRRLGRRGL